MILSPGEYHLQVPREPVENVKYRLALYRHAQAEKTRTFQRGVVEMCRRDILFYVNTFVWQFNPRKLEEQLGPFVTWQFQDEAFRVMLDAIYCTCHEAREPHQHDLVIEKSREMGASWMLLLTFEWLWHFHPWQKFLLISRDEKAVEDEDPDSLFWKLDHVHRHQPTWLLPKMKRRKLYFGNEDNGSTITGQASTGKAGVGGRATAMGIDEFSQIKEDFEVLHRTSDTTGCRIFNFTHKGVGTAAYKLTKRPDIKKLRLHWSSHPDKNQGMYQYRTAPNPHVEVFDKQYEYPLDFQFITDGKVRSPWYDAQLGRKGNDRRAVAMDLDIDPEGSTSQFFNMGKIDELRKTYCSEPYWTGKLLYDERTGEPDRLVKDEHGLINLWLIPDGNGRVPKVQYGAGLDVATGMGATPSCLSITNAETGKKVLEYTDAYIDATALAPLVMALCKLFKNDYDEGAMLAWECPGPGLVFGKRLVELGYRQIFLREPYNKLAKVPGTTWGWWAQAGPKRQLMEDYREALEQRKFENCSDQAMRECGLFKWNSRGEVVHGDEENTENPESARVNHADHVIADALSWMMCKPFHRRQAEKKRNEIPVMSLLWRRQLAKRAEVEE